MKIFIVPIMPITVAALNSYPVKSLAGIDHQTVHLGLPGFDHDRQWMVVSPDGRFLTQRTHPQMAMVETAVENGQLVLNSFGLDAHLVPASHAGMARLPTEVWGDAVQALDVGDDTATWLSQAIDEECRLVEFPSNETRHCKGERSLEQDHTRFADGFPILIISEASLGDLNSRLTDPVEMKRFRPNLVVSGCDAFAEDGWNSIAIGGISIRIIEGCARCSVPTVDPETGVLRGPEPIHTLSSYRERDDGVYFGVDAAPDQEGIISVGDEVVVLS